MNRRTVSICVAILVLALLTVTCAQLIVTQLIPSTVTILSSPHLAICISSVPVTTMAFGSLEQGKSVSVSITLKNVGGTHPIYVRPTDLTSDLSPSIGAVSWNIGTLANPLMLGVGAESAAFLLTFTANSTAPLNAQTFNIIITGSDA